MESRELPQPAGLDVREVGGERTGDIDYHRMAERNAEIERIARVIYEANRAYSVTLGDHSFGEWKHAPDWQKQTIITGIKKVLGGDVSGPEASHDSWMQEKIDAGWVYGVEKNAALKTHPCMVPYAMLPVEQRRKDHLFLAIIHALTKDI